MTETSGGVPGPFSEPPALRPPTGPPRPVIASDELFRGETEVLIDHHGSLYRLRLTRSGKLILHK